MKVYILWKTSYIDPSESRKERNEKPRPLRYLAVHPVPDHRPNLRYLIMKTKIVCAVCGEETAGNPTYSFYGSVHKWGPTDHTFEPKIVEEEQ